MEYEIYSQLYKTADSLEDRHGMRNEFKKYYSKKSAMPEAIPVSPTHNVRNAKGIVITNPQNIKDDTKQNIKQTLNDTGADPDEQEDLFAAMMKNMQ